MNIHYPYRINSQNRTATTDYDTHIRHLIERVLFTVPGERVNRPAFGSGLLQLIFAPNSEILVAATQMNVQAALQQWLGDVIQVEVVDVNQADSTLSIQVQYVIRQTQEQRVATFERGVP